MKAIVITQPGDAGVLELQEVPDPRPAERELLVRVHATALNRADLLQRRGHYPPPAGTRADIPGLEFAGEVLQAGPAATAFQPGDRVMGLLPGEGYAQLVVTPEEMALPIPEDLSCERAAAIPEVFLTAYDALRQLELEAGQNILIHAVGSGVGTAAVQLASLIGARTFGTAGSEAKLEAARPLGLDFGANYRSGDFVELVLEQTGGQGVNAILDLVGAPHWRANLASLALRGRMIVVGVTGGSRVQTDLRALMSKRAKVMGTVLRSRPLQEKIQLTGEFRRQVLPWLREGRVRPVVDRIFPLEEAGRAHEYMESNRNFGKIVLRVE